MRRALSSALAFALKYAPGFVAAFIFMGFAGLVIVEFGLFDTRASTPHLPPVAWATHTTMIHSVQRDAHQVPAPAPFTQAQVLDGLHEYDRDCSACHGAPGVGRADWAAGLTPTPPYLLDASKQWTPEQLYWIVHEGVKMTAMPAWGVARSKQQVWNIVAFLEAEPNITAADYQRLRCTPAGDAAASTSCDSRVGQSLPSEAERKPNSSTP